MQPPADDNPHLFIAVVILPGTTEASPKLKWGVTVTLNPVVSSPLLSLRCTKSN
jgi:hypothetical protein